MVEFVKRLAVVLVALLIVGVGIWLLAENGQPNRCAEGGDFAKARLLDRAERAYARSDTECRMNREDALVRIQRRQTNAAAAYERAQVQAETARRLKPIPPRPGESRARKDRRERVNARRRARERAARRSLVDSAELNPFRGNVLEQLNAALEDVPIARTKGARRTSCRRALALVKKRLLDQALITLPRSARRSFQEECIRARDELAAVRDAARGKLAAAIRKDEEGESSSARDLYAAALRRDPSLTDAKQALDEYEEESTSHLDQASDWLESEPQELEDELFWILPLLALGAILGYRGLGVLAGWPPAQRRMERMSRGPPLRWLRRTCVLRVRVDTFDGGSEQTAQGADLSGLLLDALWPPKPGSTPFPFDPHGASATPDPVGRAADFLSIFPHKALATALLKLFRSAFTPRTATITGRVLPAGDRGAGLSLSLTSRHKRRTYSTTIWERLIEPEPAEEGPQRWYRLVTPSAVWLRRYLALVAPGQGADEPDARALWAEARYEAARELSQDSAHARALYARVVDDDPNNLPAVHDLAVTELRADSPEHAVSRLRGLLTSLANDADARARWPMLNMSARYNVAVALLYAAEREDDEPSQ